jgi:ribosome-associated toxin RatA of RatAB toxin-antitoxin module
VAAKPYCVDAVEASTLIYLPPEDVYEFLVDFPRYANYSEYIQEVRRHGDDSPRTEYDLEFTWWKLSYTARSAVTDVDPPNRIDWKLVEDLDAQGYWGIEHVPEEAPDGKPDASRVRFHVEFNPESADEDMINIPPFVPLDRIIQKVIPKIETEAHRIVRRIVADLEGEERPVELTIHQSPDSI